MELMSLKQKLMLNSKRKYPTQASSSLRKKTEASSARDKGSNTPTSSIQQCNKRKRVIRPPSRFADYATSVNDVHHNYASTQQIEKQTDDALLSSEESLVEMDLPFVDMTAIKSLITDLPHIFFVGEKNMLSMTCVRACDQQRVRKTFENLAVLQTFLKSDKAKVWLGNETEEYRKGSKRMKLKKNISTDMTEYSRTVAGTKRPIDTIDSPVKRVKRDEVASATTGIIKISYVEKLNTYKINYICPYDGQCVTRTFEKFSLLLKFLQSGDVRACLVDMIKKNKNPLENVPDSCSGRNDMRINTNVDPAFSIIRNIKTEVDDSNVGVFHSTLAQVPPSVSEFQAYAQSNEPVPVSAYNDVQSHEPLLTYKQVKSEDIKELSFEPFFCYSESLENNGSRIVHCSAENEKLLRDQNSDDINNKEDQLSKSGRYGIDTSAIKPLIAGYPKISYRKRFGFYRIVCIRACDGQRVTTSFRNLTSLQTFLNSDDAKSWLMDEIDQSGRTYKGKVCPVSYNSELLVIKPEICFLKPDRLRVLCIPKCGRPKTKFFKCTEKGQNDVDAMQKVNEFLTSQSFISWITSERRCDNTGKGFDSLWQLKDTVRAGPDMRVYLEEMLNFDCTKTVDVNPTIASYLNIHHNPEVSSASHACNPSWGRAHRSDDTFSLKENAPPDLFKRTYRIVSVAVRCSSRSTMCRTSCGELLANCAIVDGHFSCCNEPIPAHNECSHCKATTSSYNKWHKMDDGILCRVCYNYLRKRKTPRPLNVKKTARKPFYTHNQCHYKLRLELMPDLQYWQVFYHSANSPEHDNAAAMGSKRFTLTERDYIDRVRSSTDRLTAKQIGINYRSVNGEGPSHPLKQYQSRCKVVDSHILDSGLELSEENITVNLDWKGGECDGFDIEVDCIEFEINDVNSEYTLNATVPTLVETKPNFEWNVETDTKNTPQKKAIKTEDSLIICYKCVIDPNRTDEPFSCNDSKDLESHIKMSHKENVICCSVCFQRGSVEPFPSLRLLNHHIRQFHSRDKGCKKTSYRTDS